MIALGNILNCKTLLYPLYRASINSFFKCLAPSLQYHSLAPMYYRNAAAAIIVYDITKKVALYRFSFCLFFSAHID